MLFIKDPDRFEKIAGGVQAIILSLAVLIGGIWTLIVFRSQLSVEQAQANLQKMNQELVAEAKIEITLELKQQNINSKHYVVVGTVAIKNIGNSTTALNIQKSPLSIYKVTFDNDGLEQWHLVHLVPLRMTDTITTASLIAHAQATNIKSFAVSIDHPGFYVAKLSAIRSQKDINNLKTSNINKNGPTEWGGLSYFTVQ